MRTKFQFNSVSHLQKDDKDEAINKLVVNLLPRFTRENLKPMFLKLDRVVRPTEPRTGAESGPNRP